MTIFNRDGGGNFPDCVSQLIALRSHLSFQLHWSFWFWGLWWVIMMKGDSIFSTEKLCILSYVQLILSLEMLKSDPAQNAIADNLDGDQLWWGGSRWCWLWWAAPSLIMMVYDGSNYQNEWVEKDDNDDEPTMERSPTCEKMKVNPCLKRVQHCINLLTWGKA